MLPKKGRANQKTIEKIFKNGRFLNSPILNFKYLQGKGPTNISFIVPKNIAKTATSRNLLRRRGYVALKNNFQSFPTGILGAVVLKDPKATILIMDNEIKGILKKLK